jgi:hypothetical protein
MWRDDGRSALKPGGYRMFRIAVTMIVLFCATTTYADDEAVVVAGKAAVTAKLLDPGSAHFTHVYLITRNGRQFVCGHVGAKTRKGVYDDAKPFVFIPNQKHLQHSAIITVAVPLPMIVSATLPSRWRSTTYAGS